jgi:predicted  nucleic acid-binding Zn-ribbon protein
MISRLQLRRLSVHRGEHILYDETFHEGVNIIHGDNGSGKSTVADFIYFALGGDLREWRKEASLAHYVLAEIVAQDAVLTLKRSVSDAGGRPMDIFFGPYEDAILAGVTRWETFPYGRPEKSYSFSQVLFKAIGIPEAISDGVSNITMHQLLRILYSDQLTPVQRIFRVERFDTWQTRQAVGDLLCGLGGYDLYALQLFLRELSKLFDDVSDRLKSLIVVASSYGDKILAEHVTLAIDGASKERDALQAQLLGLIERSDQEEGEQADKAVKRRRTDLSRARVTAATLSDEIQTLEDELDDAERFIDHLERAVDEFDDAASTFFALGAVRFEFCPSCFAPLTDSEHAGVCHLCGNTADRELDQSRALAIKLDLQMQINESRQLQSERERTLVELRSQFRAASAKLRTAVAANEVARTSTASKLETRIADTSRRIGYLDHEIEQLQQRETLVREISQLSEEKAALNARISEMQDRIKSLEATQSKRGRIAYTAISDNTKKLLAEDLMEHSDFGQVDSVTFSFAEDWLAINGDKNRVGSASGMVILKNSFLLGLFIAALHDDEFNLPRFMLMDNIEDKGMVQERSWNFQRLLVKASAGAKRPHQIIFSTSKIAPELEGGPLVVGGKYTKVRHSLRIQGGVG